jgi:hypothetical protein
LLKESLAEVCGPKVCLKLCPVKRSAPESGTSQVAARQLGVIEVYPPEIDSLKIPLLEFREAKVWPFPYSESRVHSTTKTKMLFPPTVPGVDTLLKYLEVFWVGHGLNLGSGGWKAILAWTERIVKSER